MKRAKAKVLLISLVLILTISVGGTLAYLIDDAGSLENQFKPSQVTCQVSQGIDGRYTITNTSDIAAYLRVAVVVNYVDTSGNICYVESPPEAKITAEGWTLQAGYYYYPASVAANTAVPQSITVTPGTVTGHSARVEILAQAIQSVPANVVQEAWGYTPGN